ncbi:flagellar hook-length control protein FliK [Seleniivibrio woodruffii]|uniref:flagellar hook-length control protein FliK n=1 Tax=Seleniivibrio woodruffii TaxID=1078050 RepID=UPI00240A4BA0|nr:flagellar hook-length control protein FliK [Seleniivibrio woodruffii]
MENLSILKLFSSALKTNSSQGSSSSSAGGASSSSGSGKSEFEDVFRSYLDKTGASQKPTVVRTDKTDTQKTVTGADSAQTQETETPEQVIDRLDISDEAKAELKQMLAEADTQEGADAFVQQLLTMLQKAGMTFEQVEDVMTDLAASIINPTAGAQPTPAVVLESVLDAIVEIQDGMSDPKAQFVMPEKKEEKTLTIADHTAKEQKPATPHTDTQNTAQQKPAAETGVKEAQAVKPESLTAEPVKPEVAAEPEAEVKTVQTAQADTADVDEAVIDLAAKRVEAKADTGNQNSDFMTKPHITEKVMVNEIKIEKPQDILKFAELVEIAKGQNVSKINVQLNPHELGKVNIELSEHSGKVTGKITFESETARNYFANNMESLKQQLADKGVVVENLEFLFKDFEHHEFAGWDNRQNKGGNGGQSGQTVDDVTDEEAASGEDSSSVIYA